MDRITDMLLSQATTVAERVEAIRHGISQGVPLFEMEEKLDYLDLALDA